MRIIPLDRMGYQANQASRSRSANPWSFRLAHAAQGWTSLEARICWGFLGDINLVSSSQFSFVYNLKHAAMKYANYISMESIEGKESIEQCHGSGVSCLRVCVPNFRILISSFWITLICQVSSPWHLHPESSQGSQFLAFWFTHTHSNQDGSNRVILTFTW